MQTSTIGGEELGRKRERGGRPGREGTERDGADATRHPDDQQQNRPREGGSAVIAIRQELSQPAPGFVVYRFIFSCLFVSIICTKYTHTHKT